MEQEKKIIHVNQADVRQEYKMAHDAVDEAAHATPPVSAPPAAVVADYVGKYFARVTEEVQAVLAGVKLDPFVCCLHIHDKGTPLGCFRAGTVESSAEVI